MNFVGQQIKLLSLKMKKKNESYEELCENIEKIFDSEISMILIKKK